MAQGNEIDPSGVQLVQPPASGADVSIGDYRQSGFSALSTSLAETSPELHDFLGEVATQGQAAAQGKAHAAALANSGEAFADAVRDGKMEPTQSYWFMRAYNADAAELRSRSQVSDLVDQSQSWAERTDPAQYQAKLDQALGQIAQGYTGIDQQSGFKRGGEPIANQAVAANEEYNVQNIHAAAIANTGSLAQLAITDTLKANPQADPQTVLAAMEPFHKQWIGLGNTETQWKELAFGAITGAAQTNLDPSILGLAKAPYNGGQPLASYEDANGQPFSQRLDNAAWDIYRASSVMGANGIKNDAARLAAEGQKAAAAIDQQFGWGLQDGTHTFAEVQDWAQKQGISREAFDEASKMLHTQQEGIIGLSGDMAKSAALSPGISRQIIDLDTEGATQGISKDFINRARAMVAQGQISDDQYGKLIDHAQSRSNALLSQSNTRFSEGMANARQARELAHDDKTHVTDFVDNTTVGVIHSAAYPSAPGVRPDLSLRDPRNQAALKERIKGAMGSAIIAGKDTAGVQQAVRDEAAKVVQESWARSNTKHLPPAKSPGANPLGGN